MAAYNEFLKRTVLPVYFDVDRKILVDSHNLQSPIKDEDVPWFSTRYPIKITLQPIQYGVPAVVAQTPLTIHFYRGDVEYGTVYTVGDRHPWFVAPRMDIPVGPVSVTVRDAAGNIALQFDTVVVDAIPEHPAFVPTVYSNPNSVRIPDEGERIIRQPLGRAIRLQRDASLFITDDIPAGTTDIELTLDFGSLALGVYYGCNNILLKLPENTTVTCSTAEVVGGTLDAGWRKGLITVFPDGTCRIDFN